MKRFNKEEAKKITINVVNNNNPFIPLEDLVDMVRAELYSNFNATKATVTFINYDMRGIIYTTRFISKREPMTLEFAKEFIKDVREYYDITEAGKKADMRIEKLKNLGI